MSRSATGVRGQSAWRRQSVVGTDCDYWGVTKCLSSPKKGYGKRALPVSIQQGRGGKGLKQPISLVRMDLWRSLMTVTGRKIWWSSLIPGMSFGPVWLIFLRPARSTMGVGVMRLDQNADCHLYNSLLMQRWWGRSRVRGGWMWRNLRKFKLRSTNKLTVQFSFYF